MIRNARNRLLVCVGAIACGLVACGSPQVDTSLPVDEARLLNSDVSTSWVRTQELLQDVAMGTERLGTLPPEIGPEDFDIAMVRHTLESCFTETVEWVPGADLERQPRRATAEAGEGHTPLTERPPVGRAQACQPSRMIAMEAYLEVVPGELRGFLLDRTLEVDALRVNLKDVLVSWLDALEADVADARIAMERLRGEAEQKRALAQTSDVDEQARAQAERDYDTVLTELEAVQAVLARFDEQFSDMRALRRQLVEQAARNLATMGTSAE